MCAELRLANQDHACVFRVPVMRDVRGCLVAFYWLFAHGGMAYARVTSTALVVMSIGTFICVAWYAGYLSTGSQRGELRA